MVFTAEELEAFELHGHVRLEEAFPRELALAMQGLIWKELDEDHGIRRGERGTWRQLPCNPKRAKHAALNAQLATERFTSAISDLLGNDSWQRPQTWGGFNVFFPAEPRVPWDVPTKIWHWDGSPTSTGLLIFSFYGDVRPGGGGTLIVNGSPRLIENYYASLSPDDLKKPHRFHRKEFSRWDPWLEALTGQAQTPVDDRRAAFMEQTTDVRGVPCRVLELCGEPGEAVFCDLRMLHCVATNALDQPRFMRVKFLFTN